MSIASTLHRIASDWMEARRAAQTERFISALPTDIRKDIGWPSENARSYRPAAGGRAWTLYS